MNRHDSTDPRSFPVPAALAALFVAGICLVAAGCSDAQSQQELDLVKASVQSALDAWKRGEKPEGLKAGSPPIEFHDDDWQRKALLLSYELEQVYRETDGSPRCAVTLAMKDRSGKEVQRKVTYQVNTKPNIVIGRDPYS